MNRDRRAPPIRITGVRKVAAIFKLILLGKIIFMGKDSLEKHRISFFRLMVNLLNPFHGEDEPNCQNKGVYQDYHIIVIHVAMSIIHLWLKWV
ncbi:MAG: hypothetical protein ACMUIA_07980 [bacterium]